MGDIKAFAGVEIGPGTLYAAITRLVEKKMIAPQAIAGRQRPYELTNHGVGHLKEQLGDMQRVSAIGVKRLRAL